jgi:hypothetical protein
MTYLLIGKGADLLDDCMPGWQQRVDLTILGSLRGQNVGEQLFGSLEKTAHFFGWSVDYFDRLREFGFVPDIGPYNEFTWREHNIRWVNIINSRKDIDIYE